MRNASILLIFGLVATIFGAHQALAIPSSDLRVVVIDSSGGGFGTGMTYLVNPNTGHTAPIDNTGTIKFAERIAAFGGSVYVADSTRISKINLDTAGQPDPAPPASNVISVTSDEFEFLVGIAVDGNGILYVADSDNLIYSVDPSGTLPATPTLVPIDHEFSEIRDMTITDNKLYIFDAGAADGEIYLIDLSSSPSPDYTAVLVYEGALGVSLVNSWGIAVHGTNVYVAGTFGFGPGVLKIDTVSDTTSEFSDNSSGKLSLPYALVVDPIGSDLYVSDQPTNTDVDVGKIYRLDLSSVSPSPVDVSSGFLELPSGLAIMTLTTSPPDALFTIIKTANVTSVLPGDGVLYTITATNSGNEPTSGITIRDDFPKTGNAQIESVLVDGNLSYTSTVFDVSAGTSTAAGTCVRVGDQFRVDCTGFGTLDAGDYIIVELEGQVRPGASGEAVNTATVSNADTFATHSVKVDINPAIVFSTISKTSTPSSVVAGDGSIDYTIILDNSAVGTSNAHGVTITDMLPIGTVDVQITSQPAPNVCQVEHNPDTSAKLICGPYTINNNNSIQIKYTVTVGANAQNPFTNTMSVTCDNCATTQTDSTSTTVIKESDLLLEKQSDVTVVTAGQDSIQYEITVTNNGISDADNVIITDNLPVEVTFSILGSSPECTYDSQTHKITCVIPDSIPPAGVHVVTINGTVNSNALGTITNTASVTTTSSDSDPSNNNATSDPIDVISETDISLTKTGSATVVAGSIMTYNLTVTNMGPATAVGVFVQDELPDDFVFLDNTIDHLSDPDCQLDAGGLVVCSYGDMGPASTQTKSIRVSIERTATGDHTNSAEVFIGTPQTTDENPSNNVSTVTTFVKPAPTEVTLSGIIRDFKKSHPDFEYVISDDDGIVKNLIGADSEPIYNGNPATITTTGIVNFNQWYNHVSTVNDCTAYDITLVPSEADPSKFVYSNNSFFPIDGQLFGNEGNPHNYHFTYQIYAQFVYQPGQTITITGDDDIWIFIDGKLALDQGGVQPPRTGTINLDTLGLTAGQTYDFALFFAERHTVQSNLGISTNIEFIPVPAQQCKVVDAVDDLASTTAIPVTINVLANDVSASSIQIVRQPSNGVATISGTTITYTPNTGFVGIDYLTYEASNGAGLTDTAVVTIKSESPTPLFCGLPESAYDKVIHGTNRGENIRGTQGNDLIFGLGGDDKIEGLNGNDCIYGGDGNDRINGNNGIDTIYGGAGDDELYGNNDDDFMYGEDGNDKIFGNNGDDLIDGGNGIDECRGHSGNNTILNCERGDPNTVIIPPGPAPTTVTLTGTIRDFKAAHPDMEQGCAGGICNAVEPGIVKTTLGSDGKPAFNKDTISTNGKKNFEQWYNDVSKVNSAKPFTLTLTQSSDPSIYTFDSGSSGFFPIDGELFGNEGRTHNYHFTLELHSTFRFSDGQMFKFTGDDDVWVFIDKKLVIDLGGVHPKSSATVTSNQLKSMGLVTGKDYQIDIFFAERQTVDSNFRIDTSFGIS
ncbi:fibro-slime domain-containing protein [Candidatus Nitrosotenuis uzonensis]|uniref:PA14 domain-containing protein n=1 Tax=Candidatus Nitrosotenuis uzonensis TaxID=1407055 RepID=V6AVC1_9ARCH|nr:fibro-slime domain-containing protein [Candidatus Nitrosotenuis uzonensis]CDI06555.1 exported hypothetical protein [Candidatus Nitrosotenuis uzonensis]